MDKSRLTPVYKEKGKTSALVRKAKGECGAYLIVKDGKVLYVGHSASQLYKTITRHFQSWGSDQVRVTYPQSPTYKVRIVKTTCAKAQKLENALLKKYQPKDNPEKLEGDLTKGEVKVFDQYEEEDTDPMPF